MWYMIEKTLKTAKITFGSKTKKNGIKYLKMNVEILTNQNQRKM